MKTWTDLNTRNILTLQETELGEGWYKIYFRAKSEDEKTIMVGVEGGLLPVQTYLMSDYYDWYSTPEFEFYGDTLLVWMGTYTGVGTEYVDRICIAKTKEAVTRLSDGESEKELTYVDGDTAAVEGDLLVKIPVDKEIDRATVKLESISLCEQVDQGSVDHALIRYGDPVNLNFKFDQIDTIVYTDGPDTEYDVFFDGERDGGTLTRYIKLTKDPSEQGNPLIYEGDPGTVDISQMPYTDTYESYIIGETAATFCVKLSASDYGKIVMPQGYLGGFDWYRYTLVDIVSGIGVEEAYDLIYGEPKNFNYRFDTGESSLVNGPNSLYDIYIDRTEEGGIATHSVVLTKDPTEQGNPLIYDAGVDTNVEPSTLTYTDNDQSFAIGTKTGEDHCPIDDKTICLKMDGDIYVKMVFPGGHQGSMNWYRYQGATQLNDGYCTNQQISVREPLNLNVEFFPYEIDKKDGGHVGYDIFLEVDENDGTRTYSVKLTKDPAVEGNPRIYDAEDNVGINPTEVEEYPDNIDSVDVGTNVNGVDNPEVDKTICIKKSEYEFVKLVFENGHLGGYEWEQFSMESCQQEQGTHYLSDGDYYDDDNLNFKFSPQGTANNYGPDNTFDVYFRMIDKGGGLFEYEVALTDPDTTDDKKIHDADTNTLINPLEVEYTDDADSVVLGTLDGELHTPIEDKTVCVQLGNGKYGKLVFPNGHLEEDGTGTGFNWYYYEEKNIANVITPMIDGSAITIGNDNLLDIEGPLNTYRIAHQGDADENGMLEVPISIESDIDIQGKILVKDLWIEYINEMALGQLTDPDTDDTDLDGRPDGRERNSNLWWFEAEHYASENELVEEVDHRDASNNKAVQGLAGSRIDDYGIPLINLLKSEQLPLFSHGKEFQIYFRAKALAPSKFQVKVDDSNNQNKLNDWHLVGTEYRWYKTVYFGTLPGDKFMTIEINAERNACSGGFYGPTWGVYLDKVAVLRVKDGTETYTGVDALTVSDCMNVDTDEDGRTDGEEGGEILEFEAEDLTLDGQTIFGFGDDDWDGVGVGDEAFSEDVLESSNSRYVKRKGGGNDLMISPTDLNTKLKNNMGGFYRLAARAKDPSGNLASLISFGTALPNVLPLETHHVTPEYRWYISEEFHTPDGDIQLDIKASHDSVMLDKIMLIKSTNLDGTGISAADGQATSILDPDIDRDDIPDGGEANDNIWWFEAEHHENGNTVVELDASASNGICVKAPLAGNPGLLDRASFKATYPPGDYRVYARAKGGNEYCAWAVKMYMHIYTEEDLEHVPLIKREHVVGTSFEWYVSDVFHVQNEGRLLFQVAAGMCNSGLKLDKIAVARVKDGDGTATGADRRVISDPMDPDMDHDTAPDGMERSNDVWWFEAENHYAGGGIMEDFTASNSLGVKDATNAYEVHEDVLAGSYSYLIRAKKTAGVENAVLTLSGESVGNIEITNSQFNWYTTSLEIADDKEIILIGSGAEVIVDKIGLVRTEDGSEVLTGARPSKFGDQLDADTDGEGLLDGEEINGFQANDGSVYHSKPLDRDSDDDGLVDSKEVGKVGDADNGVSTTDPLDKDTDGDGLPDGWIDGWGYIWKEGDEEGEWGKFGEEDGIRNVDRDYITLNIEGVTYYFIQAELEDRDLDGEVDIDVWNDGAGPGETDPEETDSDNGGSPDGQEVIVYGVLHSSDPAGFDNSDGNDEFIHGLPLYCNLQEIYYGTDPTNHADHPNVNEVPAWIMDPNPIQGNDDDAFEDFDGDGLLNFMEDVDLDRNYNPVLNIDLCAWDDPDTDDDGLNDYEEVGAGTDPENVDSDGDDVWDWNGPGNPNDYYEIDWNLDTDGDGLKNAMDPDSDGDGMLDEWEYVKMQEFADMTGAEYHESPVYPVRDDREKDEDIGSGWVDLDGKYHILGDGLTNWEEYAGQDDNPETMEDNTDPLDQDMDNDGLPDSEWRTSNTEPKDDDTDKDGLKDGDETTSWIVTGIQSAKGTPHWPTTSHPNKKDSDGDGLWDGDERWGDRGPNDEDNWENGDGILGLDEVNNNNYYVTDPNKPDSDDDGLLDGNDISLSDTDLLFSELDRIHIHNEERIDGDYDFWGELIGHFTYHPTNPRRGDTDDDGLMDGFNMDYDGDGIIDHLGELTNHGYGNTDPNNNNCDSHLGDNLLDGQEVQQGSNPNANPNTDGDGLSDKEEWDGWDVKLKIGGGITYPVQSDPTSVDGDGDGLSDAQERVGSDGILPGNPGDHHDATDPNNPDSDGDGLIDYQEVNGISLANTANDWDSDQGVDPGTLVMNSDEFYNYFYNDETWIINGYEWPTEGNLMSHLGTRNIGNNEKLHDTYWMMGDKDGNGVDEFYKYFYNDVTWVISGYEWPAQANLMPSIGVRNTGNTEKVYDTYWMMGDKDGNGIDELYDYFYNDVTWVSSGFEWPAQGNLMPLLGTRNTGNTEKVYDTYWMMGDIDGNGIDELFYYFYNDVTWVINGFEWPAQGNLMPLLGTRNTGDTEKVYDTYWMMGDKDCIEIEATVDGDGQCNIPIVFQGTITYDNTGYNPLTYAWTWDMDCSVDSDNADGDNDDTTGADDDGDAGGQCPVYTYPTPGTYTIKVTMSNGDEGDTYTFELAVGSLITDPLDRDSDSDGLWDGDEYFGDMENTLYMDDGDGVFQDTEYTGEDYDGFSNPLHLISSPSKENIFIEIEIDYETGHKPTTDIDGANTIDYSSDVLDYCAHYYMKKGVYLFITLDDEIVDDLDVDNDGEIEMEIDYDKDGRIDHYEDVGIDGLMDYQEPGANGIDNEPGIAGFSDDGRFEEGSPTNYYDQNSDGDFDFGIDNPTFDNVDANPGDGIDLIISNNGLKDNIDNNGNGQIDEWIDDRYEYLWYDSDDILDPNADNFNKGRGPDNQPGIAGVDDDGNANIDDASEMNWPGSDDGTGTEDNEIIDVGEDIDGDGHLDLLFTSWPVGENWRYYGKKYISEDFDMDGVIDNELHIPEINYHDNHDTHLYVYYATGFDNCLADPEFGVLMDTDFIDDFIVNGYGTTRFIAETDGLLHEVGHCLDVGSHEEPDANGDGIIDHEIYCGDSNDPDGGYSWCIMTGIYGFPDNFIQEPIYCDQCWSDFTTDHIWSTINAPIHTFY